MEYTENTVNIDTKQENTQQTHSNSNTNDSLFQRLLGN